MRDTLARIRIASACARRSPSRAADQRSPLAGDEARGAIAADFETREEHLEGVPIADTALMLERLAAARGMACGPASPLLA
jgi:hypothetical protein